MTKGDGETFGELWDRKTGVEACCAGLSFEIECLADKAGGTQAIMLNFETVAFVEYRTMSRTDYYTLMDRFQTLKYKDNGGYELSCVPNPKCPREDGTSMILALTVKDHSKVDKSKLRIDCDELRAVMKALIERKNALLS